MNSEATYKTQPAAYNSWVAMRQRCTNPRHAQFGRYSQIGGICARWRASFAAFFADMGPRPGGMSLDRKDNDGGYWCGRCDECVSLGRPANCRWAGRVTQARGFRSAPASWAEPTVGGVMLREWREATQTGATVVARAIGVSYSTRIIEFENGEREPGIKTRALIERLTAIDPHLWMRKARAKAGK